MTGETTLEISCSADGYHVTLVYECGPEIRFANRITPHGSSEPGNTAGYTVFETGEFDKERLHAALGKAKEAYGVPLSPNDKVSLEMFKKSIAEFRDILSKEYFDMRKGTE
jgi:hypothetical protein